MSERPIPFFRVSGGGNDFLALAKDPGGLRPERIAAWCRRGLSLGADGLFVLDRREGDGGDSPAGLTMDHYNADGSAAELCVNGTRCAARLAVELGWAEPGEDLEIATGAGTVGARVLENDRVRLQVPLPDGPPRPEAATFEGPPADSYNGWWIRVGVPHLVLSWPTSLAEADVASVGAALVHHRCAGGDGANVDFVRFPDRGRLEIRTFERGVNAETLACGSGVLAAVAVGLWTDALELPVTALTRGGFELEVDGEVSDARPIRWSLTGDARLVGRGEILPGAEAVPEPPAWSP